MKDLIGYEGLYKMNEHGVVYSVKRRKIMSIQKDKDGYLRIKLSKNGVAFFAGLHRLIAINFIDNPENKSQVNHINGIKDDNRVSNLEWVTCSENIIHSWKNGLSIKKNGESNHQSKLTESDVLLIRSLCKTQTLKSLSVKFKISRQVVTRIVKRQKWKHI